MTKDFLNAGLGTNSLRRSFVKTFVNEIFAGITHGDSMLLGIWEEDWLRLDELVHLIVIRISCVEWRESYDHFVCQNTEGPPVDWERMPLLSQYFWSQILWCSAEGVSLLILLEDLGQSKVCQTDVAVFAHEDIFRLQISIDDLL